VRFDICDGRVELVGNPVAKIGVALVCRIVDRFQQFGVAQGAAAVFGRATPAGLDQTRIELAGFWIDKTLDLDGVLPAVAEVVEIDEFFRADVFKDVT
jgi:hypothetical protein